MPVPWKSIFTCQEFYVILIQHFGHNWGFYTLLTSLPTYLDEILHFGIKRVRLLKPACFIDKL